MEGFFDRATGHHTYEDIFAVAANPRYDLIAQKIHNRELRKRNISADSSSLDVNLEITDKVMDMIPRLISRRLV